MDNFCERIDRDVAKLSANLFFVEEQILYKADFHNVPNIKHIYLYIRYPFLASTLTATSSSAERKTKKMVIVQ